MNDDIDFEASKGEFEPPYKEKFNTFIVKNTVKDVVENYFSMNTYEPESGEYMTQQLAKIIRDKIKESDFRRYKIVVKVYLGEKKDQKIVIMSKGYWDIYVDNYVTYTFSGNGFFCTVVVYGFYTD